MKILAVDDSPTLLDILSTTLSAAGHAVETASDGQQALAILANKEVDLIISDLNMVFMSGFELLHEVRKSPVHMATSFVFLTTETDVELKQAARSAAATAWIVKPFNPEQLVQFVSRFQQV